MSKNIDEGLARALVSLAGRALRSPSVRTGAAGLAGGAAAVMHNLRGSTPRSTPTRTSSPVRPSGDPDFSKVSRGGNVGNIPQRTNNPGNITYGGRNLGRSLGATGTHRSPNGMTYYTFDSPETGFRAMHKLMGGSNYRNLSGGQALNRWVTGDANTETPGHYKQVFSQHGIDLSRPYSEQDPVRWGRAKAQAEGFYARRQQVRESNGRLSKNDIIDLAVSTYATPHEQQYLPTIEEMFVDTVSDLSENHAVLLLRLFNDLSEDNQETMFEMVQTDEGVRELLDFAIDKYMAQKN
jgi:hypothetical protein